MREEHKGLVPKFVAIENETDRQIVPVHLGISDRTGHDYRLLVKQWPWWFPRLVQLGRDRGRGRRLDGRTDFYRLCPLSSLNTQAHTYGGSNVSHVVKRWSARSLGLSNGSHVKLWALNRHHNATPIDRSVWFLLAQLSPSPSQRRSNDEYHY